MHVLLAALMPLFTAPLPAPPAGDDLARAEADVREVFGKELVAVGRQPAAKKAALARRMIETAAGSRPAAKYALLVQARELAIAAGDSAVGVQAVAELVSSFQPAAVSGHQTPRDAASWASEGHRLWNAASDKRPPEKLRTRLDAAECYLRALEGLAGFQKAAAEKRLRELARLSPERVRELFGLKDWREEDGVFSGEVGNIEHLGSRLLLTKPVVGRALDFSVSIKAPAYHCLAIRVDGALYWFSRGHWQNTGLLVGRNTQTLVRKRPGPRVQAPDEWHTLRVTVNDGQIEMRYDDDLCWQGRLEGPGPYAMQPGFGGHRSTIQVKDFVLLTAGWAGRSTESR